VLHADAARSRRRDAAGFSLVELLIVISLLAILSAILVPVLIPSPARTLQTAASEVATTLRETRRLAQSQQTHRRFMVDTETERYGIEGTADWRQLPDGTQAALTTAQSLLEDRGRGGIDFFPDGSSTGGRVTLSMSGRSVRVDIEWLTGRIRVSEVEP
jgi:general secretion pathway protein H